MILLKLYTGELRLRFLSFVFSFFLTFCTLYNYSSEYFYFLAKPLHILRFIFTDISEAFQTYLELSFGLSFFFLLPFLLYQIFSFFVPGFFCYEKKYYLKCLQSFFSLYLFSFFFTWLVILPILWSFFTQFETQTGLVHIELEPRILTNLRFILKVFLFSQFFFQIPFLSILYFQNFGKEKHLIVSQNRHLVYIGILIICSCFCPPDVFLQVFTSICCILVFEIILFALFLIRSYESIVKKKDHQLLKKKELSSKILSNSKI